MEHNMVGWFEIPVENMDRARSFYEKVFDIAIEVHEVGDILMGWFPMAEGKMGSQGSLVKHELYQPSETHGPLLYFSCRDVDDEISRVESAGGKILQQKKEIGGGYGFMGLIVDSEGNRIALHSRQ